MRSVARNCECFVNGCWIVDSHVNVLMRNPTTHDDGMAISARRLAMNDVSHSTENIMCVVLNVEVPPCVRTTIHRLECVRVIRAYYANIRTGVVVCYASNGRPLT